MTPSNHLTPHPKLGHKCLRRLAMTLHRGLDVAFLWTEGDVSVMSFIV